MNGKRDIRSLLRSRPTVEGAGVRLKRAFGNREVPLFDPFLLLDDFHSDSADDYKAGFPWHPHRGIETVTYILQGKMEHQDSMGNRGVIPGQKLKKLVFQQMSLQRFFFYSFCSEEKTWVQQPQK